MTFVCESISIPVVRHGPWREIDSLVPAFQPMSWVVNAIRSGCGRATQRAFWRNAFRTMLVERARALEPIAQGMTVTHTEHLLAFFDEDDRREVANARERWRALGGIESNDDYYLRVNHDRTAIAAPRTFS